MKTYSWKLTRKILICLIFLKVMVTISLAQPGPYSQLDPKPYDPEKDANIDMFMGNWKESMPKKSHGSLVERDILIKGNPLNPSAKGAVLKYINRFTLASLGANESTSPITLKGEQEIFYIFSGEGAITADGRLLSCLRE